MSSSSEGEIKEGTVEEKEKKETIATTATKTEEPKRRVRRSRREEVEARGEQTMEVAKEKPTTTAVPITIPKRLLNRIDKHDTYLATIQRALLT
jgi:hypothetical protein